MKQLLVAAAGAALVVAPGIALAQTNGTTGDSTTASDMKGPPNANGYGKDTGMDKGSTATGKGGGSSDNPSATNMKGPPNANGYSK